MEVGLENVVQVVTDNASNCKAMGTMVEAEFPRIVWTPCVAHCLDLLMEDIGRLPWVQLVVADAPLSSARSMEHLPYLGNTTHWIW